MMNSFLAFGTGKRLDHEQVLTKLFGHGIS
jgi:hypothetical protein